MCIDDECCSLAGDSTRGVKIASETKFYSDHGVFGIAESFLPHIFRCGPSFRIKCSGHDEGPKERKRKPYDVVGVMINGDKE